MRMIAVLLSTLVLAACQDSPPTPEAPAPIAPEEASAAPAGDPAPEATSVLADPFRDLGWTAVSKDGSTALEQTHLGGGKCQRSCKVGPEGGKEVWKAQGCIGKRIDLRFVGNGCERVVILHQLPDVRSGERWEQVAVGHVYRKDRLEYPIAAAGAVRDFKKIRSAGNTFYWLAGALEQPGPAPGYSADGAAVEFVTVDGKKQSIPLIAGK